MRPADVLHEMRLLQDAILDPRWQQIVQYGYKTDVLHAVELARTLDRVLRSAEAYHVAPDLVDLVWAAGRTLPDEFVARDTMLPSPYGFVVFDQPMLVKDARGETLAIHAATWSQVGADTPMPEIWAGKRGVMVTLFTNSLDERDYVNQWVRDQGLSPLIGGLHHWAFAGMTFVAFGQPIGPEAFDKAETEKRILATPGRPTAPPVPDDVQATNVMRLFAAMWSLMGQTIVKSSREHADRPTARRMRRAGLPALVTSVALRHVRYDTEMVGASRVEWRHRWIVRGHWRHAHVSESHPLAEWEDGEWRAWIFIHPYLKGPDDAPLLLTQKVYGLVR